MGFYAETVFPWILEKGLRGPAIDRLTRDTLADVRGDVLEIGFGSARTLPHYPRAAVRSLHAIEPSSGLNRRAQARIGSSPFPVHLTPGVGETLPYDSRQFDSVALAFTFCSVAKPEAVLAEIQRVLKSGGTLHLLEHVVSSDAAWQRWQRRLEPMQKVIGCGCHLTRDPEAMITRIGGRFLRRHREVVADMPVAPKLFPVFSGTATFSA